MSMTLKTVSAAIALSVVAGAAFVAPASAATMIRTKPIEAAQKAEQVHYYGYYGYYYPRWRHRHHRRHYYRYYYGY